MDRRALREEARDFLAALKSPLPPDEVEATYAGLAAAKAASVAARDEYLYPDVYPGENLSLEQIDDPDDPDLYDCAFWAATAYAGFEGEPKDDVSRRLEFWTWYLNEAVPTALAQTRSEQLG